MRAAPESPRTHARITYVIPRLVTCWAVRDREPSLSSGMAREAGEAQEADDKTMAPEGVVQGGAAGLAPRAGAQLDDVIAVHLQVHALLGNFESSSGGSRLAGFLFHAIMR